MIFSPLPPSLPPQRKGILTGTHEPTDEECQWAEEDSPGDKGQSNNIEGKGLRADVKDGGATVTGVYIVTSTEKKDGESSSPATGIPEFWLTAMKNTDIFADWVKVRGLWWVVYR